MKLQLPVILYSISLVVAYPTPLDSLSHRSVAELDQAAFEEAQEADSTATKAFTNTQIKTSDGRCLFVDKLSGDFRANLTPIQLGECGSTDGQGWDIVTSGKHNNVANSMLIVSTLTNACFNFDPRRPTGNQVILFSCGGRADGSGEVTDSQLFPFNGDSGPLSLSPMNDPSSCFTVEGDAVGVGACADGNVNQTFTFSGSQGNAADAGNITSSTTSFSTTTQLTITQTATTLSATTTTSQSSTPNTSTPISSSSETSLVASSIPNPTEPVPVSRAGGELVPTAAAESHERDDTATRAFTSASIQAPNGQCLFIDPTAGDFRQNLIPVSLVDCAGTPNEKFDIVTAGKHNNAQDSALVVSSLMNGCVSFDGRRPAGDTVTIFSCGGRAAGEGDTNNGQLVPFTGGTSLILAPESERNATCIVPGNGRLDSTSCSNDGSQVFTILP
ncbi:hypothetical protein F4775DRAFT_559698 [Biscogniauxia sp. FL1348]|nr:hypothetical protein F4775DRAFT_559698 [Biscogniauxia sp. FL1348]